MRHTKLSSSSLGERDESNLQVGEVRIRSSHGTGSNSITIVGKKKPQSGGVITLEFALCKRIQCELAPVIHWQFMFQNNVQGCTIVMGCHDDI
ncbi:hypothetical protein EVAR_78160_1 [Eumeta japonica]|uniref:Uncharacterized protein n=1 Tax=Eumeta variegata TaxID=151549 RepID=A0A4C1UYL0_EUMVA|nr:hypothetical protein EVAR_78160_1 [Eumeta japonica]